MALRALTNLRPRTTNSAMSEATAKTGIQIVAPDRAEADRAIAAWLLVVAGMVFGAVFIGGLTRLTESGLSMTDWRPLTGWLPPMSEAEWREVFERYRLIPEYTMINAGMSLDEFKGIFWLEYIHRVWGRLIGVAFALPFVWFMLTRRVDRTLFPILLGLFLLGGLQGGIGWFMVTSGLSERTDVSQYRLALHLGVAIVIYILLLRTAFWLRRGRLAPNVEMASARRPYWWLLGLIGVTLISGAFVAGTNAGMTYNTFPLMDGALVPSYIYDTSPIWLAAFEDITTIQFNHRLLAIVTLGLVAWLWLSSRREVATIQRAASVVLFFTALQVVLGIATLLSVVRIELASLHQCGAVALITAVLVAQEQLSRRV